MNNRFWRTVLPFATCLAWGVVSAAPVAAGFSGPMIKALLGGYGLTQDTGLVQPDLQPSMENRWSTIASLAVLLEKNRFAAGIEGSTEFFTDVSVGPEFGVGAQTFSIQSIQILAVGEWRPGSSSNGELQNTQPFVGLGLGWNFNRSVAKLEWPQFAPDGAATNLELEDSPALRVVGGIYQRIRSLYLVGEVGWSLNTNAFRMTINNRPDRTGDYNLSGVFVAVGVGMVFGKGSNGDQ